MVGMRNPLWTLDREWGQLPCEATGRPPRSDRFRLASPLATLPPARGRGGFLGHLGGFPDCQLVLLGLAERVGSQREVAHHLPATTPSHVHLSQVCLRADLDQLVEDVPDQEAWVQIEVVIDLQHHAVRVGETRASVCAEVEGCEETRLERPKRVAGPNPPTRSRGTPREQ